MSGPAKLALIAGAGGLPGAVLAALPRRPYLCALEGFAADATPDVTLRAERLIPFLHHLREEGITEVCLVGAVRRPRMDPALFDPATAMLVPAMIAAFAAGDDATLRFFLGLLEEHGLEVRGVDELAPGLLPGPGLLAGSLPPQAEADATRAAAIVAALGAVDVGQACVVAGGLCLGVEALPGTDALLSQVAACAPQSGKGLLFKGAKPGQDRRVDLPTVGLATVQGIARAGLAGLVIEAGSVILLDRDQVLDFAAAQGLFLWAR
ncbi:LpxI family protein [Stagnihabitans tardus]|uniref:UDP-2,3-diacylglucosamine diphosphatase LpxI n=1 Tax=Stagnihabitans tardus TaxID=2699202 RepID=A0AAE4YDJ0_9RHOB|nr:UDP-2,3-diacylglucosamine diphosphatase LpxI [Stagnihabitans tardus]NBZ87895.1 UDP-2,3-diacylglucosamine diphosphatase LpxI [Stagnihabitans tardus]